MPICKLKGDLGKNNKNSGFVKKNPFSLLKITDYPLTK